MKTPFDYLCGMQCVVGDQRCPAYDVCEVNKNFVRGILTRYFNCCRRDLKHGNAVTLEYNELESLVRHYLINGFRCPVCGVTMTINNGQTEIESSVYSIEHIIPMSKGGKNNIENIILCCRKCNHDNNEKNGGLTNGINKSGDD
jgi:hypothetical protein